MIETRSKACIQMQLKQAVVTGEQCSSYAYPENEIQAESERIQREKRVVSFVSAGISVVIVLHL